MMTYNTIKRKNKKTDIRRRAEIYLRTLDMETARKNIQEFINKNPGCKTSEIIEDLRIDPELAVETLKQLKQDDLVLSKPIE